MTDINNNDATLQLVGEITYLGNHWEMQADLASRLTDLTEYAELVLATVDGDSLSDSLLRHLAIIALDAAEDHREGKELNTGIRLECAGSIGAALFLHWYPEGAES